MVFLISLGKTRNFNWKKQKYMLNSGKISKGFSMPLAGFMMGSWTPLIGPQKGFEFFPKKHGIFDLLNHEPFYNRKVRLYYL